MTECCPLWNIIRDAHDAINERLLGIMAESSFNGPEFKQKMIQFSVKYEWQVIFGAILSTILETFSMLQAIDIILIHKTQCHWILKEFCID